MRKSGSKVAKERPTLVFANEFDRSVVNHVRSIGNAFVSLVIIANESEFFAILPNPIRVVKVCIRLIEVPNPIVEAVSIGFTDRTIIAKPPFPKAGSCVSLLLKQRSESEIGRCQ